MKNNACKKISIDREVSRCYRAYLDGSNSYRKAIKETGTFSIDRYPLACIVCHMFSSLCYLVIHSILFHYIHAFIWILCTPLIIFNHLYVSWVKFYNFLYLLLIMTKRGRKCDFFLRFYILRGEIHASVRGRCVSSC